MSLASGTASSGECKAKIERAFEDSWALLNQVEGWQVCKATTLACDSVDKVEWRWNQEQGEAETQANDLWSRFMRKKRRKRRVYRVTATLPASVEQVSRLIRDVDQVSKWNKAIQAARIVKLLEPDMVITYQLTASNGGLIFPRDFVFGVKFGFKDGCFVAGGCSLAFPELPPEEDLVRAWNHPGCMAVRPVAGQPQVTTFQWLLDCDYGGWVPQHVLDLALPFSQVMLVDSLRKRLEELQATTTTTAATRF